MFLSRSWLVASAMVALGASQAAYSQSPDCSDLMFNEVITSQFPSAGDACLDVVEKDGTQFAKFSAEIVRVRGGEVRARFKRPDGSFTDTYSFNPPRSARVNIQGRSYRYSELSRGQELNIYLPPDRWEVATHSDPETDFAGAGSVVTIALVSVGRERLPTTASFLPLLGLIGALMLGLGAAVVTLRKLIGRT